MPIKVTSKGQVTLPKSVREAAGIRPGDRVTIRARPGGGLVVEREEAPVSDSSYREKLEALANRRLFGGLTTDKLMNLTRGSR